MIKTLNIGEKEVVLDNNIGWTLIYKDQFGEDILPAIMPMLVSGLDIIAGIFEESEDKNNITIESLAKVVDSDKFTNALFHSSAFEFTTCLNIIWALAKNADESIPEPKRWLREFDEFPLDVIGVEAVKLIFKGMVSSKNQQRMNELMESVHPKKKNPSK